MNRTGASASRSLGPVSLVLLAVFVGVVAGLGAIVFRGLIAFFHNLLFLGKLSFVYDATVHTPPSPWGPLIILVPVLGAAGVVFVVKNWAPEAKGTGVPNVIDAIYYGRGRISLALGAFKALASSLSIGSGAPVGREGPIIQIGATAASAIGRVIPMSAWQRITLIAAGAGGGIAATFNTPVGGILFAIEVMMHEVSVRTIVPIMLSSITATYVARLVYGSQPVFRMTQVQLLTFHIADLAIIPFYAGLGLLVGLLSTAFIKSVYAVEDLFEKRVRGSYYLRHMAAMLVVGVTIYLLLVTTGHYYIEGVGYAAIQNLLTGATPALTLIVLLLLLKWLAIALSLGSGASGGIFSPTLFMGAMAGGAYGFILHRLLPGLAPNPVAFIVAGMAGMVAGTTGAAFASIVMLFEMTFDYDIIMPVTATVALSYAIRKLLLSESMYTLKLVRRGHNVPEAMQANLHFLTEARQMMDVHFRTVPAGTTLAEFSSQIVPSHDTIANYLVEQDGEVMGLLTGEGAMAAVGRSVPGTTMLRELAQTSYVIVREDTRLLELIAAMRDRQAIVAMVAPERDVISAERIEGLVTRDRLTDFMAEAADWFEN
jgi:CIC family chloride channel protein